MSLLIAKESCFFSVKGESEYETFRPVANSDLLEVGRPEERDVDQARRERSFVRLKEAECLIWNIYLARYWIVRR